MFPFINDTIDNDNDSFFPCCVADLQKEMCSNCHVSMFNWTIIGCLTEPIKRSITLLCQQKCKFYFNRSKEDGEVEIKDNENLNVLINKIRNLLKTSKKIVYKDLSTFDNKLSGKEKMVKTYETLDNILEGYKISDYFKFIDYEILKDAVEFIKSKINIKKERVKRKQK